MRSTLGHMAVPGLFALLVAGSLYASPERTEDGSLQASLQQWGRELTSAYQECLNRFSPANQETERVAQRAWITFSNKNEAAAAACGPRRGLTQDDVDRFGLAEVVARSRILREYFNLPNADLASLNQEFARAEQSLTEIYKRSIAASSPDEEKKLREAQRAWIDYREKDARAHTGDPSGRAPVWAKIVIDRRRTAEMSEFYLQQGAVGGNPKRGPVAQEGIVGGNPNGSRVDVATPPPNARHGPVAADPTPTPPKVVDKERRAKLAADLRADAGALLAKLDTAGLLAAVASLDDVKALPAGIVTEIDALDIQATRFRKQFEAADTPEEIRADLETVDALTTFRTVMQDIAAANVPAASGDLLLFLSNKSAAGEGAKKGLTGCLDKLKTLCLQAQDEAKPLRQKADALAAAGKTAAALKQYQDAYRICPDPAVANTIKRLREDSLGL